VCVFAICESATYLFVIDILDCLELVF